MSDVPSKYYFYKIYIYTRTGRPVSGIKHHASSSMSLVKGEYEDTARRHYKDNFHTMDIWPMNENFLEVIEYKKGNGLV
jgi:hypothetical protein